LKAQEVVDLLRQYNHFNYKVFFVEEARLGAGYGASERRIDLLSINTQPSTGHKVIAYEVKVARADFVKDVKNAIKHKGARHYADQFFYVAPEGMIKPEELPTWAGLIEIKNRNTNKKSKYTRIVNEAVPAPLLSKEPPSWGFLVACLRNVEKSNKINIQGR
jgi:hypothetical protein